MTTHTTTHGTAHAHPHAQAVATTAVKPAVDVDPKCVTCLVLVPQTLVETDICGRTTTDWVKHAVKQYEHKTVEIKRGDDIVGVVKKHTEGTRAKYVLVVYADTPLLTHETLDQALSFIATYNHRVVQLTRGWLFDMDFIRHAGNVEAVQAPNLDEVDFTIAYNFSQIAIITTHMRMRINEKHMQNAVHIVDPYGTYIECDVEIGKGAFIGANCNILGKIKIGENAHIAHGSTITADVPAGHISMTRARQAFKDPNQGVTP